jgi:hypothetical protein
MLATLPDRLPAGWRAYLVVAIAVLVLFGGLWAIFGINAFWAVFGIVVGIGLAGFWSPSSSRRPPRPASSSIAPQPFSKLVRAALPLILPLLIVVVAGTAEGGALVQVAAGAVVGLFAWVVIVRPELDRLLMRTLGGVALLAVGYMVATLIIHALRHPILGSFDDGPGVSGTFLLTAIVLWTLAILLRLASFATSCIRLVEALVLAGAAGSLIAWTGVFRAPDWLGDEGLRIAGWMAVAAGLVLAAEAAAGIAGVMRNGTPQIGESTGERGGLSSEAARFLARLGLSAALVAAISLGLAVVIGLDETNPHGRDPATGAATAHREPRLTPKDQLASERKRFPVGLVRTYMPELAFRSDQQWLPQRVDRYIHGAWLQGVRGKPVKLQSVRDLPDPDDCPGLAPTPCFHLSIRCPSAEDDCSRAKPVGDDHPIDQPQRSGAVYVRVVRESQHPKLFPRGVGAFHRQHPWLLIQYWYFYRYDEWSSRVLAGNLVQRHEGDWEAVMVGLSRQKPSFVAYSQHCRGTWRPWRSIEVSSLGRRHTHPLVAVAKGSQANYVQAGQGVAPDWAECSGALPAGMVTLLSYASNIRDRTGYDFGWLPRRNAVIRAGVGHPPMSFPGYWGGQDTAGMSLENEREHPPRLGGEPRTPSMQDLWVKPLTTVFCKWHGPPGSDRETTCPPGSS